MTTGDEPQGGGAGRLHADAIATRHTGLRPLAPEDPIAAPLHLFETRVRPEWIDYNEHLNMAFYLLIFDLATDALFDYLDLGQAYKDRGGGTTFTLEAHITYTGEVALGDPLRITTQLFDFDEKRMHYGHVMYHAEKGFQAAANDLVTLHVSQETRRSAPMPPASLERLARIAAAHADSPRPEGMSRQMALTKRKK